MWFMERELSIQKVENFYRSDFDFDNSGGSYDARGTRGRGPGRFRDSSPPFDQGTRVGEFLGVFEILHHLIVKEEVVVVVFARGTDRFGFDPEPLRSEGMIRNNQMCRRKEIGFAQILSGITATNATDLVLDLTALVVGTILLGRGGPREFDAGPPEPRHGGSLLITICQGKDSITAKRNTEEGKVDRERDFSQSEWEPRGRGRGNFLNDRRFDARSERRPISPSPPPPPPVPPRDRWARDIRQRSRSPVRGGPPLKDYRRDSYLDRGREGRFNMARGQGRGRMETTVH
ncbi:hypothetical protein GIB67_041759 [Kingdonia uniflora]|uniref:Uncharacterized protein n=1 Tax=Kingdonia uniflora TaxID=39325 RepID=A0A7J7L752_9MAGN|nr:hypothetical protein GIB67_041759 [Kingdonia uniflora]